MKELFSLSYLHKLVKMPSVCVRVLTRMAQIITAVQTDM